MISIAGGSRYHASDVKPGKRPLKNFTDWAIASHFLDEADTFLNDKGFKGTEKFRALFELFQLRYPTTQAEKRHPITKKVIQAKGSQSMKFETFRLHATQIVHSMYGTEYTDSARNTKDEETRKTIRILRKVEDTTKWPDFNKWFLANRLAYYKSQAS